MRSLVLRLVVGVLVVLAPAVVLAGPPARPLALTSEQYQTIQQVEAQPEHAAVLDVQASYTSEHEAMQAANLVTDDITTGVTQGGWAGALIILLILGSPL
jgi:hypothetical protein